MPTRRPPALRAFPGFSAFRAFPARTGLSLCLFAVMAMPAMAAGGPQIFNSPGSLLANGQLDPASPFGRFLLGATHLDQLAWMAGEINAGLGRSCGRGGDEVGIVFVDVTEPVGFTAGRETPVAGRWMERFTLAGCGPAMMFNVLIIPGPGGDFGWAPMVPGETTVSFQVMVDALPTIEAAAMVAAGNPGCGEAPGIIDTRVVDVGRIDPSTVPGYAGKGSPARAVEVWSAVVCGTEVEVGVTFTEDGQGGAFFEAQIN